MKSRLTASILFLSVWTLAASTAWADDNSPPGRKTIERMNENLPPAQKPNGEEVDSPAPSQNTNGLANESLAPGQKWIEQIDGGFVFPVSPSAAAGYNRGVGGDILVGYRFNRDFSLAADVGYYDFDQKTGVVPAGEWDYTPLMAVARFNFGAGTVRPYLILGAGIAFNNYSFTPPGLTQQTTQESNFLLAPGLGILFVVFSNMALYVQGRVDMDFTPAAATGNPFSESPVLFVPLKVGASFFVL